MVGRGAELCWSVAHLSLSLHGASVQSHQSLDKKMGFLPVFLQFPPFLIVNDNDSYYSFAHQLGE